MAKYKVILFLESWEEYIVEANNKDEAVDIALDLDSPKEILNGSCEVESVTEIE